MGLGGIILLIAFAGAARISNASRPFAVCTALIGVLMLVWLALWLAFGESYPILATPYRIIDFYLFLFIAVLLTLAGCIGFIVHFIRNLRHVTRS
jgi:hypothetical protein